MLIFYFVNCCPYTLKVLPHRSCLLFSGIMLVFKLFGYWSPCPGTFFLLFAYFWLYSSFHSKTRIKYYKLYQMSFQNTNWDMSLWLKQLEKAPFILDLFRYSTGAFTAPSIGRNIKATLIPQRWEVPRILTGKYLWGRTMEF